MLAVSLEAAFSANGSKVPVEMGDFKRTDIGFNMTWGGASDATWPVVMDGSVWAMAAASRRRASREMDIEYDEDVGRESARIEWRTFANLSQICCESMRICCKPCNIRVKGDDHVARLWFAVAPCEAVWTLVFGRAQLPKDCVWAVGRANNTDNTAALGGFETGPFLA